MRVDKKEKEEAEDLIKDLREALSKNDLDDIKAKKDKLQEKAMALATKVYENVQKENQANADNSEDTSDKKDDVKDADFEEK